jgi:hypothetical protein
METPSSATIESAICSVISHLYATNNITDLTVKRVRAAAEKKCGLPNGWLKGSDEWCERSKEFIAAEAHRQAEESGVEVAAPQTPVKRAGKRKSEEGQGGWGKKVKVTAEKKATAKAPVGEKKKDTVAKPRPVQRRGPRNRKIVDSDDEDESMEETNGQLDKESDTEDDELSPVEDDLPTPQSRQKVAKSTPTLVSRAKTIPNSISPAKIQSAKPAEDSDSDLSSLVDEPLTKKKPTKSTTNKSTKPSKPTKSKPKPKPKPKQDAESTPQESEIKSLQSWLIKCGIRKLWHRELAPYETHQEKVAHLKQMLNDVGMSGRYSVEKARQIKERRELEADLEAVQDFSQRFGLESGNSRTAAPQSLVEEGGLDLGSGTEED